MTLVLSPPIKPMLCKLVEEIPVADGLLYEPKWDGFRAICFVDDDSVHLQSRNGQPLERYFPEVVDILQAAFTRAVVDAEIVVATDGELDFEAMQMRIHPAESRVKKLAAEIPATVIAFDLLEVGGRDLRPERLDARREALASCFEPSADCWITPQTAEADVAREWFDRFEGAGCDGLIAKRADQPYAQDKRVMWKIKHRRTADCVVGGYRPHKHGGVGSLLLGLYEDGEFRFVGHTSSFKASEREPLLNELEPLRSGDHFTDEYSPAMPSRWNDRKDDPFVPLRPERVVEVSFDFMQGHRFRHATRLLRWRIDKDPQDCTYDQIRRPEPVSLEEIRGLSGA